MSFQLLCVRSQVQTPVALWFLIFFSFSNSNKKMIEILMKICAKITIIVVENRESYYFIIIYKCKEVSLSLFSYQMLASTFDSNEWSSYYKVYKDSPKTKIREKKNKNRIEFYCFPFFINTSFFHWWKKETIFFFCFHLYRPFLFQYWNLWNHNKKWKSDFNRFLIHAV